MPKPLLVLGSVNADLYVEIDRLPAPGETIPGREAAVRPGGKGGNQAAAAAMLGAPVRFAGQVGDDVHGSSLREALAATGADVGLLRSVPGPSGQAFILLQAGGENSIIIVGGANQAWSQPDASILTAVEDAAALVLQREVPDAVNHAIAAAARSAGVPVILDAGGADDPLPAQTLGLIDILSPNETELARLAGMPTDDDDTVIAAARALQQQGVGDVLVKLGARGSLLVPRKGQVLRQGVVPVEVVDTTGAGDCFTGAYAVALAEGRDEAERLRFAAAAAALCVTVKGALPSMPTRAAVDQLLGA